MVSWQNKLSTPEEQANMVSKQRKQSWLGEYKLYVNVAPGIPKLTKLLEFNFHKKIYSKFVDKIKHFFLTVSVILKFLLKFAFINEENLIFALFCKCCFNNYFPLCFCCFLFHVILMRPR